MARLLYIMITFFSFSFFFFHFFGGPGPADLGFCTFIFPSISNAKALSIIQGP